MISAELQLPFIAFLQLVVGGAAHVVRERARSLPARGALGLLIVIAASMAYVLLARPVERSGLHSFEYALPNYLIPSIVGYSACVMIVLLAPESADRKATVIAGAVTGGILQFVIAIGMVVFA